MGGVSDATNDEEASDAMIIAKAAVDALAAPKDGLTATNEIDAAGGSNNDAEEVSDATNDEEMGDAMIIAKAAVDAAKAAVQTACVNPESDECAVATTALEAAEDTLAATKEAEAADSATGVFASLVAAVGAAIVMHF